MDGMLTLTVSIVTYAPDIDRLRSTLESLGVALDHALDRRVLSGATLWLIDNGPGTAQLDPLEPMIGALAGERLQLVRRQGHGNVGYGAGHNLAIHDSGSDLHLVLNPDVELEREALAHGVAAFSERPRLALLAPVVVGEDGAAGHLCKSMPTLFDLLLRGFAPAPLRARFGERLARYALTDIELAQPYPDPPLVSGCFMLMCGRRLREAGCFDPGFFLYFEDFDLTRRLAASGETILDPAVRIRHFGGDAAGKGLRHIRLFLSSAYRFFNRHGWRWW
jgi:GT2 family glycosyltransferase